MRREPPSGKVLVPATTEPGRRPPAMNKSISMFGHLLQVIPKTEFFTAVKETGSERGAKGFSCWDQFVAMLFCQMGQAKSLREICGGLASCLGKLRHLGIAKAPTVPPCRTPTNTGHGGSTKRSSINSLRSAILSRRGGRSSGSGTRSFPSTRQSSTCVPRCSTGRRIERRRGR